jgi:hypothetical protein
MNDAALADMLADMSDALDARLAHMRWRDALRDAARCTSADEAASVRHRFELARDGCGICRRSTPSWR